MVIAPMTREDEAGENPRDSRDDVVDERLERSRDG